MLSASIILSACADPTTAPEKVPTKIYEVGNGELTLTDGNQNSITIAALVQFSSYCYFKLSGPNFADEDGSKIPDPKEVIYPYEYDGPKYKYISDNKSSEVSFSSSGTDSCSVKVSDIFAQSEPHSFSNLVPGALQTNFAAPGIGGSTPAPTNSPKP